MLGKCLDQCIWNGTILHDEDIGAYNSRYAADEGTSCFLDRSQPCRAPAFCYNLSEAAPNILMMTSETLKGWKVAMSPRKKPAWLMVHWRWPILASKRWTSSRFLSLLLGSVVTLSVNGDDASFQINLYGVAVMPKGTLVGINATAILGNMARDSKRGQSPLHDRPKVYSQILSNTSVPCAGSKTASDAVALHENPN